MRRLALILIALTVCALPAQAQVSATQPLVGALRGGQVLARKSGDFWDFGEDLIVNFERQIDNNASTMVCTAVPALPGAQPPQAVLQQNTRIGAQVTYSVDVVMHHRKPGTKYTINCSGIVYVGGGAATFPAVVVQTPGVPAPQRPVISVKAGSSDPRAGFFYCSMASNTVFPGIGLWPGGTPDGRAIALHAATGVQCLRYGPAPSDVALNRASYVYDDANVQAMLDFGIQPLYAIITGFAPVWAQGTSPGAGCGGDGLTFATPAFYSEYVTAVVAHMKATFPTVKHFEIGTNEPNSAYNWCSSAIEFNPYNDKLGVGMAYYLKAGYAAIHAAIPDAVVEAPNLTTGLNAAYNFTTYLTNLENGGCKTGVCWDAYSMHVFDNNDPRYSDPTYGPDPLYGYWTNIFQIDVPFGPGGVYASMKRLQGVACAHANRDCNMPMAITETGSFTSLTANNGAYGVDPGVQAAWMSYLFNWMLRDPTMKYVVWDETFNQGFGDPYDTMTVYNDDLTPKPAFNVLRTFATY